MPALWTLYEGQARDGLAALPDNSAQMIFTSTPYWAKRDYLKGEGWIGGDPQCNHAVRLSATIEKGYKSSTLEGGKRNTGHQHEAFLAECPRCGARRETGQIGLETDPDLFIAKLADVFDEAKRVLHPTGTLWVNMADGYAGSGRGPTGKTAAIKHGERQGFASAGRLAAYGLADKQLIGLPWRMAFELQRRGWIWRQWLPWVKTNASPENVGDRPNTSIEPLLLFSKRQRYFFDMPAARSSVGVKRNWRNGDGLLFLDVPTVGFDPADYGVDLADHFAVMPPALAETCILAGTPAGGVCPCCFAPYRPTADGWQPSCRHQPSEAQPALVVDPFAGSATTGDVALRLRRRFYGCELSAEYARLARARLAHVESKLGTPCPT